MELDTKLLIILTIGIGSFILGWILGTVNLGEVIACAYLCHVEALIVIEWTWIRRIISRARKLEKMKEREKESS